jgi:hypothetical protein
VARKSDDVTFVVTLKDGTTDFFTIDQFTLRTGDHVARIIAWERQRDGTLEQGEIVKVERRA